VPISFHLCTHATVTDLSLALSIHLRLRRRVLHFAGMPSSAQQPCFFGLLSVVTGTLKVSPCQMNQVPTLLSCCVWVLSDGKMCDAYHIFAMRHSCTYCTRIPCARHRFLAYAFLVCARTVRMTHTQLSFVDLSMVVPKVTPSILT